MVKRKIKLHRIEQGVCPYCGSTQLEYGKSEFNICSLANCFQVTCLDCYNEFTEWYELEFVGHNVGDNKDIELDAGVEGVVITKTMESEDDFHLENSILGVKEYMHEITGQGEIITLEEFEERNLEFWDYPLSEMDYVAKEVKGRCAIVRFPNPYSNEDDYRICQLPEKL